jgi:hypothetical protein
VSVTIGVTVIVAVAELLLEAGSVPVVVTAAVEVAVPAVEAVALIVTDTDCFTATSPRVHVTSAEPLIVHEPLPALTVPGVRPLPSW